MKERILRIMRKTSLTDEQKLKEIFKLLSEDHTMKLWVNQLVSLSQEEIIKLNWFYWDHVIKDFIERLDRYIYGTGKKYASHYLTILNWIKRDGKIHKIPQTYQCSYGQTHRRWEDCDCTH